MYVDKEAVPVGLMLEDFCLTYTTVWSVRMLCMWFSYFVFVYLFVWGFVS